MIHDAMDDQIGEEQSVPLMGGNRGFALRPVTTLARGPPARMGTGDGAEILPDC